MTLLLNFSENASQQQIARLDEWLKEMGLVKSFQIASFSPEEPDAGTFIEEMLVESEADFSAGRTYTSAEAKKELEKWLKERR